MNKKILVITEINSSGSGYTYLMTPLLDGISKGGHEVIAVGLSYDGWEHNYGFTITPAQTVQDAVAIASNIIQLWKPDLIICGLDIPLQISIHEALKALGVKYLAITPLENPPLVQSWVANLMMMSGVLFISDLGKRAGILAGLPKSDHLQVSVDTKLFRVPSPEERERIRKDLGVSDKFVILTVADNQERKNLWAEFEIVSNLKKDGKNVKLVLVTREHSPVGHKLRDLAIDYDINKEVHIIERGIPQADLWKLYASSDLYLSTSKAEGLGIPILEAMASGLLVAGNDTGAITEILMGRGFILEVAYKFRDVWGNSWRHMVDIMSATSTIKSIIENKDGHRDITDRARMYVESRTLEISVNHLLEKIESITHE